MADEDLTLGDPDKAKKWTRILFLDGSTLRVWWDGTHEVAWRSDPVVIYGEAGRLTMIPYHRIDRIVHQGEAQ